MPRLLRVIDGARWDDFVDNFEAWNGKGDIPGAVIGDLRPSPNNRLSVWLIEDGDTNLDRVIAGFAAARPNIDAFEARLVDAAAVQALGIKDEKARGQSKDSEANERWHHNLIDLTHLKLAALARLLASSGAPLEYDLTEVEQLIVASVKAGHISLEALKPKAASTENSVWTVICKALGAAGAA